MAAAAALAFATPFGFAQPAHAAVNHDSEQASLTFVTHSGVTVTCTLLAHNSHYTDDHLAVVSSFARRTSDGNVDPLCAAHHQLHIAYKDQEGDENTLSASTSADNDLVVTLNGVQGNVRATHDVGFSECDLFQSATCYLTLQTSTK